MREMKNGSFHTGAGKPVFVNGKVSFKKTP
jgi:hypothetical protein